MLLEDDLFKVKQHLATLPYIYIEFVPCTYLTMLIWNYVKLRKLLWNKLIWFDLILVWLLHGFNLHIYNVDAFAQTRVSLPYEMVNYHGIKSVISLDLGKTLFSLLIEMIHLENLISTFKTCFHDRELSWKTTPSKGDAVVTLIIHG